ncbi:MAG: hypothetical protein ABJN69_08205 [Hellea sp.]
MAFLRRKKKITAGGGDDGMTPVNPPPHAYAPRAADLTVGDYANGMPNIRLGEMLKSFGRQLFWVVPLFLIGSGLAWHLTKDFKRSYTGDARILVQIGDEYVYQPITGQPGQAGMTITADTIALNEVGILKNAEIIEQVFGIMTGPTSKYARSFDPQGMKKLQEAGNNERLKMEARSEMYRKMDRSFMVSPRPKSSLIDLSYKHENGEVAVETLNQLILAYQSYRRQIFVEGSAGIITERRKDTERQLNQNEGAIARLLQKNNISDFDSEQGGARKRTEELRASLNFLRAQMAETEAGLATVENQLRGTPQQVDLYREDPASGRVAQAELELKQLLAKYLPTSDPVRQKQTELAELRSLQTSNSGKATGRRRVGPNTVYQALLTRRNTLQATADSYREKEFTLQRQLDGADSKVRRLTALSPDYANLLRQRDTLDARLKNYNSKEQEALVNQQQAEATNENVKVISWPKYPNKGRNTRLLAFVGASFAWGLTLFMMALLRVFLDPRLYAAPASRRETVMHPEANYIPEPVSPYAPSHSPGQAPHMPAAELATAAVPVAAEFDPAAYNHQPAEYDAGAYAQAEQNYASGGSYAQPYQAQAPYADHSYGQTPYADSTTSQYGQNPVLQSQGQAVLTPYDPNTAAIPFTDGSAAVDLNANPYLTGKSAGSLDQASSYEAPFNPDDPHG